MYPSDQRKTNSPLKNPYLKTAITLTVLGIILIILSIFLEITILAVISLGIIFWGIFFAFAKTFEVVPTEVFNSSFSSTPNVIDKIIQTLNFEKGAYVPPRYFENTSEGGVLLFRRGMETSEPEELARHGKLSLPLHGYYWSPPGIGLVDFWERKLGASLTGKGIEFLENALVKVFVEYGIAEDVQIEIDNDIVHFKVTKPIYGSGCEEIRKRQSFVCIYIGCPFCSALAYMLAKATGKIVLIERNELSSDNRTIDLWCRIVESKP